MTLKCIERAVKPNTKINDKSNVNKPSTTYLCSIILDQTTFKRICIILDIRHSKFNIKNIYLDFYLKSPSSLYFQVALKWLLVSQTQLKQVITRKLPSIEYLQFALKWLLSLASQMLDI